ncbi:caspase domain-containing protein [Fusarium oxysporum]|nr:caspase domain-containing protein [Fusarium oxysporum]
MAQAKQVDAIVPDNSSKSYWAVLIGIDHYTTYRKLNGCIQDVEDVEQLLKSRLPAARLHVTRLTASGPEEQHPPTYDRVMAALINVKANAEPGDFVYIHFSGHGARLARDPQHPSPLTGNQLHEVLLLHGHRHLKDYELGKSLDELAGKGLSLFVVLDCCHSGGADRVADDDVRGIDEVLPSDVVETAVASQATTMDHTLNDLMSTRDGSSRQSYWERARDYTILAACQPHEKAREIRHNDKTNGALTHWMLKSMGQLSAIETPTYERLHRDIYANMFIEFPSQHPMLLGEGDRLLLGSETFRSAQVAHVIETTATHIFIDSGDVHGVQCGEEYGIFERSAIALDSDPTIATVVIDQVGGLRSSAKILTARGSIQVGCLAKLLTPVLDNPLHVAVQDPDVLQRLQEILETPGGFGIPIQLHPFQSRTATFQVLSNNAYQIADATGQLIPNCPTIPADEAAAKKIHQVLQKLARYRMVTELHNKKSNLGDSFAFRVSRSSQPAGQTGTIEVYDGECVYVELENFSDRTLYYTVFDLTPRWAVERLLPWQSEASGSVDATSRTDPEAICMEIPAALHHAHVPEIQDLFKVVVTTEPSSFGVLESQAISIRSTDLRDDEPVRSLKDLSDVLESLGGVTREGKVRAARFGDWQTGQVVVKTRTRLPSIAG